MSTHPSRQVDAIIIGAQKCATTSVFDRLSRYPEISGSREKETNFWSRGDDGEVGLTAYHDQFDPKRPIWLEASPSYAMYPFPRPDVPLRMHRYNPALKLIYIMRAPLERMRSAYQHLVGRGYYSGTFEDFLLTHPRAIAASRYGLQIQHYLDTFPREQLLAETFETVVADQQAFVERVARFVGATDLKAELPGEVHSNVGAVRKYHYRFDELSRPLRLLQRISWRAFEAYRVARSPKPVLTKPQAPLETERQFLALMEPDIRICETLLERPLPEWRQVKSR